MNIEERRTFLTKDIHNLNYRNSDELVLRKTKCNVRLRIWISRSRGNLMIYMRLDKYNQFSVPLCEEALKYISNPPKEFIELLKFGFCSHIENLNAILEITNKMKHARLTEW